MDRCEGLNSDLPGALFSFGITVFLLATPEYKNFHVRFQMPTWFSNLLSLESVLDSKEDIVDCISMTVSLSSPNLVLNETSMYGSH